ncbi:MAG: helix-turn-helix domain-containing protein [Verrucomicrobiota bacterium]
MDKSNINCDGYHGFHDYLPINDEIFRSGFYVTSAGQAVIHSGQIYPPALHPPLYQFRWNDGRTLPEFSLILITAGRGTFESRQTGKIAVTKGMVILIFPGVWHRYRPDTETGWTEKWVQFNGELVHRLWNLGMMSPDRSVVHLDDAASLEVQFDPLIERIHHHPVANSFLLSLQALRILTFVLESISGALPAPGGRPASTGFADPVVMAALEYIWTRSHTVLSVTDVANHAGVARRTLDRRMAAAFQRTVLDEIIRCRFSRAERLLRETQLPVKTVASLAGFGSTENMRQVFLQISKVSPAAYRRVGNHQQRPAAGSPGDSPRAG